MNVNWKVNISVTTILFSATVVLLLVFVVSPFNCDSKPSHPDWVKLHTELESLGYKPATHSPDPKPIELPPAIKQNTSSALSGSGYWVPDTTYTPDDSVAVEVSAITLIDNSRWVKVTIDGQEVKWHRLDYYHRDTSSKWTLFAEVANADSPIGIGAGYRIWKPLDINVSPALSVSTSLDWVAGEIRLSRNVWSGVAFGGGAGGRLVMVEDDLTVELHLSAGISIEL